RREEGIVAGLRARIASAREAIDAPDPIGSHASHAARPVDNPQLVMPALEPDARFEAGRSAQKRAFGRDGDADALGRLERSKWWIARVRRSHGRRAVAGRATLLFRFSAASASGRLVASRLVPVAADARAAHSIHAALLEAMFEEWKALAAHTEKAFWATRTARLESIADAAAAADEMLFQPALFDRRAERLRDERQSARERFRRFCSTPIAGAGAQIAGPRGARGRP